MRLPLALLPLFALVAGTGAVATGLTRADPPVASAPKAVPPRVKLAVLVMFDQLRGDYLDKWRPLFGPDGFARLQADGAWFANCHYPYATTTTGPGHASVSTGATPARHGIVNNDWHEKGRGTYCASSDRYTLVPPPPPATDPKTGKAVKPPEGGNSERLRAFTLSDAIRRAFAPAKIFGLSLKDRSAIFPVGHYPTGAFWFNGRFVTSTYYTERLERPFPAWVTRFNDEKVADQWFGREWTHFRPGLDYAAHSGRDDGAGEGGGSKQARVFPHPTTGGLKAPGRQYYDALANSPFGNEMLLELVKRCVVAEKLGADDVPDLLTVSFSSNDLIGHTWGPDSQEVLDVTLRSDALMAELLRFLDRQVGRDNYAIALTADHGVCPLPESPTGRARGAKRVDQSELQKGMEKHLAAAFGADPKEKKTAWIEAVSGPWVHLNDRLIAAKKTTRAAVARSLAGYLGAHPDVARAFTREELERPGPADARTEQVRRSYYAERCGDVYVLLKPFDLPGKPDATGTTHGTPYRYDTWVPLLAYGPGVAGGRREELVTPQAAAAILARFVGLPRPDDAEYGVPETLGR